MPLSQNYPRYIMAHIRVQWNWKTRERNSLDNQLARAVNRNWINKNNVWIINHLLIHNYIILIELKHKINN